MIRAAAVYFAAAVLFAAVVRGGDLSVAVDGFRHVLVILSTNSVAFVALLALVLVVFLTGGTRKLTLLGEVMAAALATGVFLVGFNIAKTSLPYAIPFFADPALAALDRMLHGGRPPWELTHSLADWLDPDLASVYYVRVWLACTLGFPVVLALFDRDAGRCRRYLALYGFVWIGLGNLLALAFMSAGPVYHDRLFGGQDFAALAGALEAGGIDASLTGFLQDYLWHAHTAGEGRVGSGISAFPSVHVAMALVIGLYAAERMRWLAVPAILHVAATQFLSVHLGWHYAVDGYFSIIATLGAALWLRRAATRETRSGLGSVDCTSRDAM